MTLCIEHPEADKLARQLAAYTGETPSQAVIHALREQLRRERLEHMRGHAPLKEELLAIGRHCAALPVLDDRTPDEIIGYNQYGVPE